MNPCPPAWCARDVSIIAATRPAASVGPLKIAEDSSVGRPNGGALAKQSSTHLQPKAALWS
ncbi:Hypothetical protein A7982_02244 [Minicystis rosea]|nr:Hypothetical protein A7982_02244 [Minicystis rosea]